MFEGTHLMDYPLSTFKRHVTVYLLQGKMQSENLLRSECGGYDSDEGGGAGPLIRQGHHYTYNHHYNVTHYH